MRQSDQLAIMASLHTSMRESDSSIQKLHGRFKRGRRRAVPTSNIDCTYPNSVSKWRIGGLDNNLAGGRGLV
jgi:hypothetical protein